MMDPSPVLEPVQACSRPARKPPIWCRAWQAVKTWLYLNLWCRHLYRPTMKLLHRFNLHHAPPSPMSPEFGKRDHWCKWCGLRGSTWRHDPMKGLEQFKEDAR